MIPADPLGNHRGGILGPACNSSRICGSTPSTSQPRGRPPILRRPLSFQGAPHGIATHTLRPRSQCRGVLSVGGVVEVGAEQNH